MIPLPTLSWVKLAIAGVALIGAFSGGWILKATFVEAALSKERAELLAKHAQQVLEYQTAIVAEQDANTRLVRATQDARSRLAASMAQVMELKRNAPLTPDVLYADRPFSLGFVGVWNATTRAGNGDLPAGAQDPAGASPQAGAAADLTREEILTAYQAVVTECTIRGQQIEAIIKHQEQ